MIIYGVVVKVTLLSSDMKTVILLCIVVVVQTFGSERCGQPPVCYCALPVFHLLACSHLDELPIFSVKLTNGF